jgi:hypothetical protein
LAGTKPENTKNEYDYDNIKGITAETIISPVGAISGDVLDHLLEKGQQISNVIYLRMGYEKVGKKATVEINEDLIVAFTERKYDEKNSSYPAGIELNKTTNGLELYNLGALTSFIVKGDDVPIYIAY